MNIPKHHSTYSVNSQLYNVNAQPLLVQELRKTDEMVSLEMQTQVMKNEKQMFKTNLEY